MGAEDGLTTVRERKLKWYVHATRASGLAKTSFKALYQAEGQADREKKWTENILEWADLNFNDSQMAAQAAAPGERSSETHWWCPNDPVKGYGTSEE